MPLEDVALHTSDPDLGLSGPANTIAGQAPKCSGSFAHEEQEQFEDIIPRQVECQLISNSIGEMTLASTNFVLIDPFNSMP